MLANDPDVHFAEAWNILMEISGAMGRIEQAAEGLGIGVRTLSRSATLAARKRILT